MLNIREILLSCLGRIFSSFNNSSFTATRILSFHKQTHKKKAVGKKQNKEAKKKRQKKAEENFFFKKRGSNTNSNEK